MLYSCSMSLWVLLSFNKWYVISIINHGAHWWKKLCRKSYKSHARLDSYASLHGLNSKEWEGPVEQNYGLYLRSGANLIVFFLAISLPLCSNWLFRLTPKNTSFASGYTLISIKSNQYFHSNAQVLWTKYCWIWDCSSIWLTMIAAHQSIGQTPQGQGCWGKVSIH